MDPQILVYNCMHLIFSSHGVVNETILTNPQKLHEGLVKAFPDLGRMIINLKKDQLNNYWNEQIAHYYQNYQQDHG
jgi:type VI protein secretion system component VasK